MSLAPDVASNIAPAIRAMAIYRNKGQDVTAVCGDRACLALALARQETAVTAEKLWPKLNLGVPVESSAALLGPRTELISTNM